MDTCVQCSAVGQMTARGLCRACYPRHRRGGTLDAFPRRTVRSAEVVEEYRHLSGCGLGTAEIARRLGMRQGSLEKALQRARKRGTL